MVDEAPATEHPLPPRLVLVIERGSRSCLFLCGGSTTGASAGHVRLLFADCAHSMCYRMELSTLVLERVSASFRSVPRVLGHRRPGGHPVPSDLLGVKLALSGEKVQVTGAESSDGGGLRERDQFLVLQGSTTIPV